VDEFKRILGDPVDRRRFMKRMSAAGLGIAAITLLDGVGPGIGLTRRASAKAIAGSAAFPNIPGKSITEIVLNYALTLEFLEADLYRQALNQASGLALTTPLAEDPFSYNPTVGTGGLSADAAEAGYEYLVEFAYVEAAHRDFLRATLAKLKAPITTPDANGKSSPSKKPASAPTSAPSPISNPPNPISAPLPPSIPPRPATPPPSTTSSAMIPAR
jgi:hypothetical protein